MADLYNVAGSRIYIGGVIQIPTNQELDVTDFSGQSWTEIAGWQTCGSFGDTAQATTTTLIAAARDRKTKGSKNAGTMENTFAPDEADPGQIKLLEAAKGCDNYAFRVIFSAGCERSNTVTISVANPGVVTWANHGLKNGSTVQFSVSSGGALPTGLTTNTVYYVVGADSGTFQVAATPDGTPIETTVAGSGTITATAVPMGRTKMFGALVMGVSDSGGDANAAQLVTSTLEINSNIVTV